MKIKLCELRLFLSYNKELRRRRMRRSTVRQVGSHASKSGRADSSVEQCLKHRKGSSGTRTAVHPVVEQTIQDTARSSHYCRTKDERVRRAEEALPVDRSTAEAVEGSAEAVEFTIAGEKRKRGRSEQQSNGLSIHRHSAFDRPNKLTGTYDIGRYATTRRASKLAHTTHSITLRHSEQVLDTQTSSERTKRFAYRASGTASSAPMLLFWSGATLDGVHPFDQLCVKQRFIAGKLPGWRLVGE
ncbi:uncharacterized protein UDID_18740 [Ustilago sp. UG-2017a]|nr:uncharacterized protein UDID_18740 [Ustilago sp. UG-2017a]